MGRVLALVALLTVSACTSTSGPDPRNELLAHYPPGTPRAQVQATTPSQPKVSELRPAAGWAASPDENAGSRAIASEQRTGHTPQRVEAYFGACGLMSLCSVWFYYDQSDRVIDADYQGSAD